MGICCDRISNEFYNGIDDETERDIRNWEESIGAFKYTFSTLRTKLNINELNNNAIIKLDISSEVFDFLNQPFFKEKESFSNSKLNAFIFLFSRPEKKTSENIQYFDKTTFIIQEILKNEEENLNSPIEENNSNLINLLNLLIDISFELTKFYMFKNGYALQGYFKELFNNQEKLSSFLIKMLFKSSNMRKTTINSNDLNSIFKDNRWFLTPGYFRETIIQLNKVLINQKA